MLEQPVFIETVILMLLVIYYSSLQKLESQFSIPTRLSYYVDPRYVLRTYYCSFEVGTLTFAVK